MVGSIHCADTFDDNWYNIHGAFTYDAAIFSSGFVLVSASVDNFLTVSTGAGFYVPAQTDWATAPVYLAFGAYSGRGSWRLSFDRTTNVFTVKYTDIGMTAGKLTWTPTPDKCVITTY